jgi:hypothetical protein
VGDVDWVELLANGVANRPAPVVAETYVRKWETSSKPVLLSCSNERDYVVKDGPAGRAPINDQIVARLGAIGGCPTGRPMLVEVPQALIDAEPDLSHLTAGVWHGSEFAVGYSDAQSYAHTSEPNNRPRFASLAILFGWICPNDPQFIYSNDAGREVMSVDHGHFFPGGPGWTIASLGAAALPAPDAGVITGAGLSDDEVADGLQAFTPPTNEQIADAVGVPPDHWGLSDEERITVSRYLADRRDILFT